MFAAGVSLVTSQWLFDTLSQLYHQYQTPAAYVLGVLTQPLLSGLLSRLPSKEIMRRVKRRTEAEDEKITWLRTVATLAEDAEHGIQSSGVEDDGSVPPTVEETIDELVALRSGPDHPESDVPRDVCEAIRSVRNATADTSSAPTAPAAKRELEDLLATVAELAETELEEMGVKSSWYRFGR